MANIIDSNSFNTIYNLDQKDRDWSEFCNAKTEERAIDIASRVYVAITTSPCDVEKITKFTQNLNMLNGKFKETGNGNPLTSHIEKLNNQLESLKPKSGASKNVSQIKDQFEIASKSNSIPSKNPTPVQNKPSETSEEIILKRFQSGISKLDINSLTFSQDLVLIQNDLKKLNEKGLLSEKESKILGKAFTALKQGYSTPMEDSFFYTLAGLSPPNLELKMDEYENCKKKVCGDARSDLLKFVQGNCKSPAALAKGLRSFEKQAKEKLSKNIASQFLTEEQKKHAFFNNHFIDNFPALCKAYGRFQDTTNDIITYEIDMIEKKHDLQSGNLFSPLIKHYSYMNLQATMSLVRTKCEKRFILQIGLKNINAMDPNSIGEYLKKGLKSLEFIPGKEFQNFYVDNLKDKHEWLANHAQHVKKSYNQGDDPNAGNGCCFNNCLDRFKLFSTHPGMQPQDIPMQCSAGGKFAQMRSAHAFHVAQKEVDADMTEETFKKSLAKAQKVEKEAAHRLDLKVSNVEPIKINSETSKDPLKSLIRKMKEICKIHNEYSKGKIQFLFSLFGPAGAHAINIQFDSSNNVFRFIDDNLGICEFKSIDEFAIGFYSYMNVFYKDDKRFVIEFFEPK
jgi:hypothetical protein